MNKKIKVMVATILSIFTFSALQPAKYSIMITKTYAAVSTYALADRGELTSLEVKSTDEKSLDLCDNYDGYNKDLTDEKNYYVTLDGKSDGIKIFAQSAGDDYIVKVFESDRKNATAHNVGENISLEKGKSTLYIRTFTSEDAFKRAEKKEDVTNCDKTYKINIYKTAKDESDDIYIDKVTINSGNIPISFDKNVLSYNISVKDDVEELTIRANPEDNDYTVKIAGFKVTEEDRYQKTLHLQNGENEIKINVTDVTDKMRTYILNITRGGIPTANNSSKSIEGIAKATDNSSKSKYKQWVQSNNNWQYIDDTGTPLKNVWFYDRNNGKNYYLQADGNMATGWFFNNGYWYYLDESGARQSGWLINNGEWYYLDLEGVMKTGWVMDMTGRYYYLQENGVMAKNTTIDKFKLGNDGAWIK